jgi:hypothetical protein
MMDKVAKQHPLNALRSCRVGGQKHKVRVIGYVLEGKHLKVMVQYETDPMGLSRELTGRLKPKNLRAW